MTSFYQTTVPTLSKIAGSAISFLTAAKAEIANGNLPSEQEVLDAQIGSMLPFRLQPILLAKFSVVAIEQHKLNGAAAIPVLAPTFASFDNVIDFFQQLKAVFDAIDEKAYNESAGKQCDVAIESVGKTLHMTQMEDYFHSFVIPNSFFHLNAMYMLLRGKGFTLGKGTYVGAFMSEQQMKDWAPLRG